MSINSSKTILILPILFLTSTSWRQIGIRHDWYTLKDIYKFGLFKGGSSLYRCLTNRGQRFLFVGRQTYKNDTYKIVYGAIILWCQLCFWAREKWFRNQTFVLMLRCSTEFTITWFFVYKIGSHLTSMSFDRRRRPKMVHVYLGVWWLWP